MYSSFIFNGTGSNLVLVRLGVQITITNNYVIYISQTRLSRVIPSAFNLMRYAESQNK